MPDYKNMYLEMVDAAEKAINILIEAQRNAEEIYISADESYIKVVPDGEATDQTDK